MTTTNHLMFLAVTIGTLALAPALTLPTIGGWALMAWLGREVDTADVSDASGCGWTMVLIVVVGLVALAMLFVGGAAMEGRI